VKRISILLLYLTPLGVLGYGIYSRPHVVEELASLIPSWSEDSPSGGHNECVEHLESDDEIWARPSVAPTQSDWASDEFPAPPSNFSTPSLPPYDPNVRTAVAPYGDSAAPLYPETHALAMVDPADPYAGTNLAAYDAGVRTQDFRPPAWTQDAPQPGSSTGTPISPASIGELQQGPAVGSEPASPAMDRIFPERTRPAFPSVGGMPPVTVSPPPTPIVETPVDPYARPDIPAPTVAGPYPSPMHPEPYDNPVVPYSGPQEDPARLAAVLQPRPSTVFPTETTELLHVPYGGSAVPIAQPTESPQLTTPPIAETTILPIPGEMFIPGVEGQEQDQHQIRPLPAIDSGMTTTGIPPTPYEGIAGGLLPVHLPPFAGGTPVVEAPPFEQHLLGGNDLSVATTNPVGTDPINAGPPMVIPSWGEPTVQESTTYPPEMLAANPDLDPSQSGEEYAPIEERSAPGQSEVREESHQERAIAERPTDGRMPIEGATVLARIGNNVLMACDVTFLAHDMADSQIEQMEAAREEQGLLPFSPEAEAEARMSIVQQYFPLAFQERLRDKLFCADAKRTMPPEAILDIEQQLRDSYNFEFLPIVLEESGFGSRTEFARHLESRGSSLGAHRQYFIETQVAKYWRGEHATAPRAPTYDELYDYYMNNLTEFETVASAQWEQLTVAFPSSHCVNEEEAVTRLAEMGDAVYNGTPLEDVARESSEGLTAARGGLRSWTSPGELRSEPLNEAIFSLPVGRLSRIIRDEEGFHIVLVIEREEATKTPFIEAQIEIQGKLLEQFKADAEQSFLNRIAQEIPIIPSETIEEDIVAITGGTNLASNGQSQRSPMR